MTLQTAQRTVRRTRAARRVRRAVAIATMLILVLAGGGCGSSGAAGTAPSAPPTTSLGSPGPTRAASAGPSADTSPTPTPAAPEILPTAQIETTGKMITGTLGTYSLDGRGSDTPWLPFSSLPAASASSGERVTIQFVGGFAIGQWAAVLGAADDVSGSVTQGAPGGVLETNATRLTLGPLPVGRWVLQVRLTRLDGRADGETYWALTVR